MLYGEEQDGRHPARTRPWHGPPQAPRGPVTSQMRRAMTAADLPGRIRKAVHELIGRGAETGVQVAVVRHGAVVADGADGVADPATGRPVSPGTLFWAASLPCCRGSPPRSTPKDLRSRMGVRLQPGAARRDVSGLYLRDARRQRVSGVCRHRQRHRRCRDAQPVQHRRLHHRDPCRPPRHRRARPGRNSR